MGQGFRHEPARQFDQRGRMVGPAHGARGCHPDDADGGLLPIDDLAENGAQVHLMPLAQRFAFDIGERPRIVDHPFALADELLVDAGHERHRHGRRAGSGPLFGRQVPLEIRDQALLLGVQATDEPVLGPGEQADFLQGAAHGRILAGFPGRVKGIHPAEDQIHQILQGLGVLHGQAKFRDVGKGQVHAGGLVALAAQQSQFDLGVKGRAGRGHEFDFDALALGRALELVPVGVEHHQVVDFDEQGKGLAFDRSGFLPDDFEGLGVGRQDEAGPVQQQGTHVHQVAPALAAVFEKRGIDRAAPGAGILQLRSASAAIVLALGCFGTTFRATHRRDL